MFLTTTKLKMSRFTAGSFAEKDIDDSNQNKGISTALRMESLLHVQYMVICLQNELDRKNFVDKQNVIEEDGVLLHVDDSFTLKREVYLCHSKLDLNELENLCMYMLLK